MNGFLFGGEPPPMATRRTSVPDTTGQSNEERIAAFNEEAASVARTLQNSHTVTRWSSDFRKKPSSSSSSSATATASVPTEPGAVRVARLHPIRLSELVVAKTHRGRCLFGRIVSEAIVMTSATVLIQDIDGKLEPLAVYGLADLTELANGRYVAILEPFYKIRADQTTGIRVDDPSDLVFDVQHPQGDEASGGTLKLESGSDIGDDIGLSTASSSNRPRMASNKTARNTTMGSSSFDSGPASMVLPDRHPETQRMVVSVLSIKYRDRGNKAFKAGRYKEAEQCYSAALDHREDTTVSKNDATAGVPLWQLFGNRCAARLKLGMLDKAVSDSIESYRCAPADVLKPVLRFAEALSAVGVQAGADQILLDSMKTFPDSTELIEAKRRQIAPSCTIMVGKGRRFTSIALAAFVAPPGALILVEPGRYNEPLELTKPVTIRCLGQYDEDTALREHEEATEAPSPLAEIAVTSGYAILCAGPKAATVHIMGFRISTSAPLNRSIPALIATGGARVYVRTCLLSGTSGPVVSADGDGTNLMMHTSVVHDGASGGVLACRDALLSMKEVRSSGHGASGLEVREGAAVQAELCEIFGNGDQGAMAWKSAGALGLKSCKIHSHPTESGVLVSETVATIEDCEIFGNNFGVSAQQDGNALVEGCNIHDNSEGVLIQDTGSGNVQQCSIHSNTANGVFIGFDHQGTAAIVDNNVFNNHSKGILIGNKGRVVVKGNVETGNKGLLPILNPVATRNSAHCGALSTGFAQRMKQNKATIEKAMREQKCETIQDVMQRMQSAKITEKIVGTRDAVVRTCTYCRKTVPIDAPEFKKCSRCKAAPYCSKQCQKLHWPKHKKVCTPPAAPYPTFLDRTKSV